MFGDPHKDSVHEQRAGGLQHRSQDAVIAWKKGRWLSPIYLMTSEIHCESGIVRQANGS